MMWPRNSVGAAQPAAPSRAASKQGETAMVGLRRKVWYCAGGCGETPGLGTKSGTLYNGLMRRTTFGANLSPLMVALMVKVASVIMISLVTPVLAQQTAWVRASAPISGRYGHAMAYDSARGVTVLFGGFAGDYLSDTWEWNGTVWTRRTVTGPPGREYAAMVFDAARR